MTAATVKVAIGRELRCSGAAYDGAGFPGTLAAACAGAEARGGANAVDVAAAANVLGGAIWICAWCSIEERWQVVKLFLSIHLRFSDHLSISPNASCAEFCKESDIGIHLARKRATCFQFDPYLCLLGEQLSACDLFTLSACELVFLADVVFRFFWCFWLTSFFAFLFN